MIVGIMSMQRIINYGSYMQALSLKLILEKMGHEVVFVDYKAKPSIQHRRSIKYWMQKGKQFIKSTGLVWTAANLYRGRPIGYRARRESTPIEKAFKDDLMKLGVDYSIFQYNIKVDALIIGSDEVFNCLQNADNVGFSMELFGKNNKARKLISFAASFGNTTLERLNEFGVSKQIGRYLKKFDDISVRDENSAKIIRALVGREPYQHFDPALIGGIENMAWDDNDEQGYVAVYAYPNRITRTEGEQIKAFADREHLRIISLCGEQNLPGFENIEACAPSGILPFFKNAEYVVTDTFHGTIFSVINHVPFAVYCRKPEDVSYSNSEKLLDLLKKLNLTDRIVSSDNLLESILKKPIDFKETDAIRMREKNAALDYLDRELR